MRIQVWETGESRVARGYRTEYWRGKNCRHKLQRSTQGPLQVSRRVLTVAGMKRDNLRSGKESSKRIRENSICWVGEISAFSYQTDWETA